MKQIKVLGSGCARCNQLADVVKAVVSADGIEAEIEKIEDIQQIISWGVMSTPALVVDGQVCCKGRVPSADELRQMLTAKPHGGCCCGDHAKGVGRQNGTCC